MSLEVKLRHGFGGFTLDAEFSAPGGVTALFGRSGSGKTTVVNALAGLLRPPMGRVVIDGRVLLDTEAGISVPVHRRRVGYVFQEARLFPHLTVRQNLLYGQWVRGVTAGPDLERVLDMLGIGALLDRRPGALSGGEKARVALGRALMADPQLLLMDEPLASLDEARKAEILPYLERLRDETRLPIVYVSHSIAEVARLATTIVVMEAGRVLRIGPAADVLSDPSAVPALGVRDAGAVLDAKVEAHDDDGLTRLTTEAGPLWLPRVGAAPGSALRIRIAAQDVMLATVAPVGLSALNILACEVMAVRMGEGPGAIVQLHSGNARLLARITQRSATAMGLVPGMPVFAIIKSVSVAHGDVGMVTAGAEAT
jgi:molybdate transport system ATP-binding protein